jgi:hypothetical protein
LILPSTLFARAHLLVAAAILLVACADNSGSSRKLQTEGAAADQCLNVDSALNRIKALDGNIVTVCGVLKYEFEDINLYQSNGDAKEYSRDHCLSLAMPVDSRQNFSAMSGKRVRIEATATAAFCPEGTICAASCSSSGLMVKTLTSIR